MNKSNRKRGRIGLSPMVLLLMLVAALVLVIAIGLYRNGSRDVPPEPSMPLTDPLLERAAEAIPSGSPDGPGDRALASDDARHAGEPDNAAAAAQSAVATALDEAPLDATPGDESVTLLAERVDLEVAGQRLRAQLDEQLAPDEIDRVADARLLQRIVVTLNSLDSDPVPLRFRPMAHVPGLPSLEEDDGGWRLPDSPDGRYSVYRAMFDRVDATGLASLFRTFEPELEQAWRDLGEASDQTFRQRVVEVARHLSAWDVPTQRPHLQRPRVLYEFADPALEQLSWGRKLLIRIGPGHAIEVQRKLAELADLLASEGG